MMRKYLFALAALLAGMSSALGADMAYKAPAIVAPVLNCYTGWSGWVIQGFVGGDWNNFQLNGIGRGGGSVSPSAVAFGGESSLYHEFGNHIVVGHDLMIRYGDPSISGTNTPYWRADTFAVLGYDFGPLVYAGVGVAAQTLKINILGTGATDPTYGFAAEAGMKFRPVGDNWVIGVKGLYENMNGFSIAGLSTKNNNWGFFVDVGYFFH